MKNLLNQCPAFMQRLWCQLAISYSLLSVCAMAFLVMILYGVNDYKDFHETLTLENVEKRIAGENLTASQAILNADNVVWQHQLRNNIREKLINLENVEEGDIYRITNSSRPEVYIQITDINERTLMSDPAPLPKKIAVQFASSTQQTAVKSNVTWLAENSAIWVDMPVKNDYGVKIGRLKVLFIAEFDLLIQLQSVLNFLFTAFDWVLICSVPIGIACGLVAAHYVKRQLQQMNEVTESWRQGNFQARIALPNDDVLIRHSQHLNDMAQDLELSMSLKQNLAVSDERNRVARELHDTVKQKLFALGLQLATVKAKPAVMDAASENILEAETITREAQYDLMEIITQLRPVGTSDTSLIERIGVIADDFMRRFDVSIKLSHYNSAQYNAHAEHHMLRIVQESLMNAVRHGKATVITITGVIDNDTTTLTLADNGIGFDTDNKTEGFGITSMRDRMRDLPQGKFNIKSTAGAGTKITLSWKNES